MDLSHWTSILYVSALKNGVKRALTHLHEVYRVLANLLEKDKLDLEEATNNMHAVEVPLCATNPHDGWSDRAPSTRTTDSLSTTHLLLDRLNILLAEKAAIENYGKCIQSTQMENELASQDSTGKGPAIPFLPPRTVVIRLNNRSHRTWCLQNIILMAPIPSSIWKIWSNLTEAEVKAYQDRAPNMSSAISEGQAIANSFPLALYDHYKCTTTSIVVHAKQEVLTCPTKH